MALQIECTKYSGGQPSRNPDVNGQFKTKYEIKKNIGNFSNEEFLIRELISFVFKRYKQQTLGIDKFYAVKHKMCVNRLVVLKIAMSGYYFDIRKKI